MQQRLSLKEKQIDKEPGCSSIEVNGEVHELVAGGRLHPRSKEIYHETDDLGWSSMAMEQDCYEPIKIVVSCELYHDLKWVLSSPMSPKFSLVLNKQGFVLILVVELQ